MTTENTTLVKPKRKKAQFSHEQRMSILKESYSGKDGATLKEIAEKYGMCVQTLYDWRNIYSEDDYNNVNTQSYDAASSRINVGDTVKASRAHGEASKNNKNKAKSFTIAEVCFCPRCGMDMKAVGTAMALAQSM